MGEPPDPLTRAVPTSVLTALRQAPLGIAIFDTEMRYLAASSQFLTDQGLPGDTPLVGRVHYDVFPQVPQRWRDLHARVLREGVELRDDADPYVREDGATELIRWSLAPWRTEDGQIGGMVLYTEVVTEAVEARRRHEAEQAQHRDQLRLLINELNHRVKNTLATVQSMAIQTIRRADDPRGGYEAFEARLVGLAEVHDVLTRAQWHGAQLSEVAERALQPFVDRRPEKVLLEGPTVWLEPAATLTMALLFHELATNAVKYGALSADGGRVELTWTFDEAERRLVLDWRESGGPPVVPPQRTGFGTRLIHRALAGELRGSAVVTYDAGGLHCAMQAMLPPLPLAPSS